MRKTSGARKSIAVVLLAVLLASFLFPLNAAASETKPAQSVDDFRKVETHYDIAVVFDNSLSMFYDNPTGKYEYIPRWSRAKFAMEIFASMLDLGGGDTLTIFPMWKVVSNGERTDVSEQDKKDENLGQFRAGENDTIKITKPEEIDNINRMHTIFAGGTPFDPVANALSYLKGLAKDNNRHKWLVILTDGEFDSFEGNRYSPENRFNINEEIKKLGTDDVEVQFLSIDMQAKNAESYNEEPVAGDHFYVDNAVGAGIQDKLIEICNRIFQRDKLPESDIKGTSLNLGISMRRVIVFVQGENVEIQGLQDMDGNKMAIASNSGQRKFSDYSFGYSGYTSIGNDKVVSDSKLYGQVVTFENCPVGDYTLDVKGSVNANTLQVFYEPNVRVISELYPKGSDVPYKDGDRIYKGEYTVKCSIVDGVTGDPVSDSPLLGDKQEYTITVTNNGKTYEIKNGQDITLEPDDKEKNPDAHTAIDVEFTYLERYTIKNTDSPWSSERGGFTVPGIDPPPPPPASPTLSIDIENVQKEYLFSDHDKWDAVRVNVKLNGEKLTDEQLNALEINLSSKNKETPNASLSSIKKLPGESAFEIRLYKDENGVYLDGPEKGKEKLKVECKLKGEHKQEAPASWNTTEPIVTPWGEKKEGFVAVNDEAVLVFSNVSSGVRWLIRGIVAALIITIFVWFMSQKALPNKIARENFRFEVHHKAIGAAIGVQYDRRGKKITIQSPQTQNPADRCQVSLLLYPVSRRWTPSRRRQIGIRGVNGAANGVTNVTVSGVSFIRDKSGLVVKGQDPKESLQITGTSHNIRIIAHASLLTGTLESK